MSLSIGIVGLPNVGKSTTFNALTKAQNAEAANYPFCTIEPNKAIVVVPDVRVDKLVEMAKPQRTLHATVEFVDIAGLVKGASRGEGLGNQFLGNIRETAAIVHVVRCFEDDNILHVNNKPNPADDIEVINTELILADIQQLERKIERTQRQAKTDRKLQPLMDEAARLKGYLDAGNMVVTYQPAHQESYDALLQEMRFITQKKVIFAANVDEAGLTEDNAMVKQVRAIAAAQGAEVVKLCAKLEEEMGGLSDEERNEFLDAAGVKESGLSQVIQKSFRALGLINYFTVGVKEVRAWTIHEGWTAPQSAGVIHSDFERGFIRAQVIAYDDFVRCKGEAGAKAAGVMRVEGKEYIVKDGDIMHFLFNV